MSPIHSLVTLWRSSRLPVPGEIAACRCRLLSTAVEEIQHKLAARIAYDPFTDQRVIWASQWLAVAAGDRDAVDPDVEFLCRIATERCPHSAKHSAAADRSA